MSFTVRLSTELAQVEPGGTHALTVELANRSDAADEFELTVEGLDADWTAVPVPHFKVEAHEQHAEKLLLKPPRVTESIAGSYPFVVKVRSLQSGESRLAQAILEVRPFNHLSIEVSPKRGQVSPTHPSFDFEVTVMNLGNSEHQVQLFAAENDDACVFTWDEERQDLAPGVQRTARMTVAPARRSILASSRLHSLTVSARSIEAPSVVASTQAQLEQRALASPGAFVVFLLLVLLGAAWYAYRPKPPSVESLMLDRTTITLGQSVQITWRAENAQSVKISAGDEMFDSLDVRGARAFTPRAAGVFEIVARAYAEGNQSSPKTLTLNVEPPVVAPAPRITAFKIEPTNQKVGQTFAVSYQLSPSVVKATLSPPGISLDPKINQIELKASRAGQITYRLLAENAEGKTAERTIKVNVVEASAAAVVVFTVKPQRLPAEGGTVTVTWQLTNAVRAELSFEGETQQVDPAEGTRELPVSKSGVLTLTGYDSQGLKIERKVRIEVAQPEPQPNPPPTTTDGGTEGG